MVKSHLTNHHFLQDQAIDGHTLKQTNWLFPQMKPSADISYRSGTIMEQEDIPARKKPFGRLPPITIGRMLKHGSLPMSKDVQSANR